MPAPARPEKPSGIVPARQNEDALIWHRNKTGGGPKDEGYLVARVRSPHGI
jgi:hypothetical protein